MQTGPCREEISPYHRLYFLFLPLIKIKASLEHTSITADLVPISLFIHLNIHLSISLYLPVLMPERASIFTRLSFSIFPLTCSFPLARLPSFLLPSGLGARVPAFPCGVMPLVPAAYVQPALCSPAIWCPLTPCSRTLYNPI